MERPGKNIERGSRDWKINGTQKMIDPLTVARLLAPDSVGREQISIRLRTDVLKQVDSLASATGSNRSRVLEALVKRALQESW